MTDPLVRTALTWQSQTIEARHLFAIAKKFLEREMISCDHLTDSKWDYLSQFRYLIEVNLHFRKGEIATKTQTRTSRSSPIRARDTTMAGSNSWFSKKSLRSQFVQLS
jgi:hypothetical protein